jgi:site-specific recombinase
MALSPASAIILGAAGISSLLAGKVNNPAHAIGAIFILAGLLLFGIQGILWLPLAALALAGIADEIGNDFFEKRLRANKILRLFFEYRMAMKFAVFFLALLSFFGWEYFAGFLAFDLSYAAIGLYSQRLKPKPSQGYFSRPQ